MKNVDCPTCGKKQWSMVDCNYVELFGTCWSEDKKRWENKIWENKELSLEEFELREKQAMMKEKP